MDREITWDNTSIDQYRVRSLNAVHIVEYFKSLGAPVGALLEGIADAERIIADPDSYLPLADFYRLFANCHRLHPHLTIYDWHDVAQRLHAASVSGIMRTLIWLVGPSQLYSMAGSYIMRINNYGRLKIWEMSKGHVDMISEIAPSVVAAGAGIYLQWTTGVLSSLPAANGGRPADTRILYDHARLKNIVEQLYGLTYREENGAIWIANTPAAKRICLESESRDGDSVLTPCEAAQGQPNAVRMTRDVVIDGRTLLRQGDIFDAPYGRVVISWKEPPFWRRWFTQFKRLLPMSQMHRRELDYQIRLAEKRYFESEALRINELAVLKELKAANQRLEAEILERQRFEAEKEALTSQLQQAQKMKALGTLAGGIAHDFNNILTPILGFAEMTLENLQGHSEASANLQEILQAGSRAKNLVRQILAFSRQEKEENKPIRLHRVIQEAMALIRASLPSTIVIQCKIDEHCGPILGDATKIHQIVINLCTNARHAMKATGGTLQVTLSQVELTEQAGDACPSPGAYARLEVSDTGTGMPREVLEHIFDPYFTTKEQGEGTGLGLSVVHGLVTAHGGHIQVTSEPGKGATFTLLLPVHTWRKDTESECATEIIPTGTETVLVVDDEEQITRMLTMVLAKLGYRVETRASASDALAAIQTNPNRWDVVVTDFTMPQMTGLELARQVETIRPDLPVIICTGFSEHLENKKSLRGNIADILFKPVSREDLAKSLRRALDRRI
ncbi:MAG: ATP-binding protein [Pseudomonadota bacterium]